MRSSLPPRTWKIKALSAMIEDHGSSDSTANVRASESPTRLRHPDVYLFWISMLALFLELLLIRWVSTEIRVFAYLQNTILVVCFLGLGLGLYTARQPIRTGRGLWALVILAGLLAVPPTRVVLASISELIRSVEGLNTWGRAYAGNLVETGAGVALGLYLVLIVMLLIVEAFIPIGRLVGRLLDSHPRPIVAYSINVAGSLVGIWLFVLLSVKHLTPVTWFALLAVLLVPLLYVRRPISKPNLLGLAVLVLAAWFAGQERGAVEIVWSPYQKLALFEDQRPLAGIPDGSYFVRVNNIGYHTLIDLQPETLTESDGGYPEERIGFSVYDVPFLLHQTPRRVLVVGSGGGNDVAGALRNGAERVTAVEIDPAIVEFGRRYHPERPYDAESVDIVVDDARSFFARTQERFDVILFGALDAHTTTAMTNARLDHYVYTRSSLERARALLDDGGMLVLVFYPIRPFIADRLAVVLRDVFDREPVVFRMPTPLTAFGDVATVLVAGDIAAANAQITRSEPLRSLIGSWRQQYPLELPYVTPPTTDDWPYLYLARPTLPTLFLLFAGLLGLLIVYARRHLGVPAGTNPLRWPRSAWHFFFLGAAFLLLEVQNISKAAVVLGNTWIVNAVIISAVLCMVLLANAVVAKWPRLPLGPVYGALIGSALALYFVDLARFAFLPFPTKALLVGVLTTLPMLFSGIVFVRSFKVAPRKDFALGANLYGALVGGLLQSISFLTGIKFLLLIVATFYMLALLTRNREPELLTRQAPEPAVEPSVAGLTR